MTLTWSRSIESHNGGELVMRCAILTTDVMVSILPVQLMTVKGVAKDLFAGERLDMGAAR